MAEADSIVNNSLNADTPSRYIDWLSRKTKRGELPNVSFGFYTQTTDEETIRENAVAAGILKADAAPGDADAFWEQIGRDIGWLEANTQEIVRLFGLYVQDEGHAESGARISSAYIFGTLPPAEQSALAKKIVDMDEMPSTTNGSFWRFFPHSETVLYGNVSEIGRKLIDVAVEFIGTDALRDWLKLNLIEALDPDDPEAFLSNFRERHYKLFYGDKKQQGAFVGVYRTIEAALQTAKERKLCKRWPFVDVWIEEEGYPDASAPGVIVGSEPTGVVYDVLPKPYYRVEQRGVSESDEGIDVDSPEGYLDKTTGWIDTFLNAGMTPNQEDTHRGQFWKRYECHGFNYMVNVGTRRPHWITVERNDALYGTNYFQRVFEYPERYLKGMIEDFTALNRLLTKAITSAFDGFPAVDEKINRLYEQHKRNRQKFMMGRIKEAADDPEIQRYIDQASPEPCFTCGADLTQPSTVTRTYISKLAGYPDLTLAGHYDPNEGTFDSEEKPSLEFWQSISHCDLPEDCDICNQCGKSTAKPNSVRNESDEEVDVHQYLSQIHDLRDITYDIQNYGLFVNKIEQWGKWLILGGGAYWATLHGKDDEEPLKAEYFRGQIEQFMRTLGITQFHIKVGQTGVDNEHVWFQLGLPKSQVEQESWQPYSRNTSGWPDQPHSTWLPESEVDDPKEEVFRLMANAPLRYAELRNWRPYIHHDYKDYSAVFIVPVFTHTGRLSKANSWLGWKRMKGFTHSEPPTWEQEVAAVMALLPDKLPGLYPDKLKRRGFQIGQPYDPYRKKFYTLDVQEALVPDPDSPEANIERHTANLDVQTVLAKLGFTHHPDDKRQNRERWTLSRGNEMVVVLPTEAAYVFTVCFLTKRPELNGHAIEHDRLILHLTKIGRHLRSLNLLSENELTLGVPDPDNPEQNVERFAQRIEQTRQEKLDATIDNAISLFNSSIDVRGIDNARRADELAAEIGSEWAEKAGYPSGSDEFDWIMSAVNNAAGEAFPGDWEDYPVQEARILEPEPDPDDIDPKAYAMALDVFDPLKIVEEMQALGWVKIGCSLAFTDENVWLLEWNSTKELTHDMPDAEYKAEADKAGREAVKIIHRLYPEAAKFEYYAPFSDGDFGLYFKVPARMKPLKTRSWESVDDPTPEYIKSLPIPVKATCIEDHMVAGERAEAQFNAADWFEQATLQQLIILAKNEFQSCYEADEVGEYFFDTQLKDWHEHYRGDGFEVYIDEEDTKHWIEHNRPDWCAYLWPNEVKIGEGVDNPDSPEASPADYFDKLGTAEIPKYRTVNSKQEAEAAAATELVNSIGKFFTVPLIHGLDDESAWVDIAGPFTVRVLPPDPDEEAPNTWINDSLHSRWNVEVLSGSDEAMLDLEGVGWLCAWGPIYRIVPRVSEGVDDPTPQFIETTFDVPTILKRMGYERHGEQPEWSKDFRRFPTDLDLMIGVRRRGQGGEANEGDVVYDITLYRYPTHDNPEKNWKEIANRYARNNVQVERALKALEARIKANNLRGIVPDRRLAEALAEGVVPAPVPPEDDPDLLIHDYTQRTSDDPDKPVEIKSHTHGSAKRELEKLGFQYSTTALKHKVFGEPEVPEFWHKRYPKSVGQVLFIRIFPEYVKSSVDLNFRTRYMPQTTFLASSGGITVTLRGIPQFIAIVKELDAVMRAKHKTQEQEKQALEQVAQRHSPTVESVPPPEPDPDDPTDVIKSHAKPLLSGELTRLDFKTKRPPRLEWYYSVQLPRSWWKQYPATDGKVHALSLYFISGQTPEVRANNWNFEAKAWYQRGKDMTSDAPAQNEAHFCAIIRDLDDAMMRCAAASLPPDQEHEALQRILKHHRKWWDDTLDYLIRTQHGTIPGRIGPGEPA